MTSLLLSVVFVLSAVSSGLAADSPTQLIVVRAADDSLWKATCNGSNCSGFTAFPGRFGSTPTVIWDEVVRRYYVWGRASNGTIWRSSFTREGNFNNDWVPIPGNTPTQVGAAGSVLRFAFQNNNGGNWGQRDVATISDDCNNMTDLTSTPVFVWGQTMYANVYTDGIYNPGLANKWVRVCISTTSGAGVGTCMSWAPIIESSSVGPEFEGERRFALNRVDSNLTQNTTKNYYLKACREAGATGTLLWDDLNVIQSQ